MTVVVKRRVAHVGRLFMPLVVVMAGALAVIGTTHSLPVALVGAAVVGLASGFTGTLYGSLILSQSAPDMVARVASLSILASLGLAPLALLLAGATATAYGGASGPFGVGAAIALTGALPPLTAAPLRRAELG